MLAVFSGQNAEGDGTADGKEPGADQQNGAAGSEYADVHAQIKKTRHTEQAKEIAARSTEKYRSWRIEMPSGLRKAWFCARTAIPLKLSAPESRTNFVFIGSELWHIA